MFILVYMVQQQDIFVVCLTRCFVSCFFFLLFVLYKALNCKSMDKLQKHINHINHMLVTHFHTCSHYTVITHLLYGTYLSTKYTYTGIHTHTHFSFDKVQFGIGYFWVSSVFSKQCVSRTGGLTLTCLRSVWRQEDGLYKWV